MVVKIKRFPRNLKRNGDSFCVDDCIATYAGYVATDYEKMYMNVLRAPYDIVQHNISLQEFQFLDNIEKFTGIVIKPISNMDFMEHINEILYEISKGNIIAIDLAGYWCPWDWRFQEIDNTDANHEFLILDWDKEKQQFICLDPYYKKENVVLPIEYCIRGCQEVKAFQYNKQTLSHLEFVTALKNENNSLFLNHNYEKLKYLGNIIEYDMLRFINNISKTENYENTYLDLNNNIVYSILNSISDNRYRYAVLLQYFEKERFLDTAEYSNAFICIAKIWNTILLLYTKHLYLGKLDVKQLKEKINAICNYEKEILKNFTDNLLSGDNAVVRKKSDLNPSVKERYIIKDILEYCNNKGIASTDDNKGDFNGRKEFFLREAFPTKEIFYSEIPFVLVSPEKPLDNIICKGQKMSVPEAEYTAISLLACSDWGEAEDFFILYYSDQTSEKCFLKIHDWNPDWNAMENNVCIKSKKTIRSDKKEYENSCIYFYEIKCEKSKKLQYLEFPNCENIHIFAVSLVEKIQ